jgi:hypothetical protein
MEQVVGCLRVAGGGLPDLVLGDIDQDRCPVTSAWTLASSSAMTAACRSAAWPSRWASDMNGLLPFRWEKPGPGVALPSAYSQAGGFWLLVRDRFPDVWGVLAVDAADQLGHLGA